MGFLSRLLSPGFLATASARQATAAYSLNTAEGTTAEIAFEEYAGGTVFIPSGSSITQLTYYAAPCIGGTFLPAYDDTATTPVALSWTGLTAGRSYPIPAKLFSVGAIKIVTNASGTVYISRKS